MDTINLPLTSSSTELLSTEKKAIDKVINSQAKLLAETVKQIFFSPFVRMMRFIYTGITDFPDVFVLGTDKEDKFRYGKPDQGLALVHLKQGNRKLIITEFFTKLDIGNNRHEVVNLSQLGTLLTKCKWNIAAVTTHRDKLDRLVLTLATGETDIIAEPVQTYFVFQKIKYLIQSYISALLTKSQLSYIYPYSGDDNTKLTKIVIDSAELSKVGFTTLPVGYIRVMITRGLDWLQTKDIIKTNPNSSVGLRFWCPSGSSLFYMHVCENDEFVIATTRCNFFLIVHQHKINKPSLE